MTHSLPWTAALVLGALIPPLADAQQRDPKVEVYGLTGGYYHGNLTIDRAWKPQFGAGVLAPLGGAWGALFDVTTSALETRWNPDGAAAPDPGINTTRQRRIVFTPTLVRLWRRERFSIYAGFGAALEHERQRTRQRPIVARDPDGRPVLAPDYRENTASRTHPALALRLGTLVSLSPRVVLRAGYTMMPRYADERPSMSLEAGLGYRF